MIWTWNFRHPSCFYRTWMRLDFVMEQDLGFRLKSKLIEVEILTGCTKSEIVFIPQITLILNDTPYKFKRLQFLIKLRFVMTINKCLGSGIALDNLLLSRSILGCLLQSYQNQLALYCSWKRRNEYNVVYPVVLRRWWMFLLLDFEFFMYSTFILNKYDDVHEKQCRVVHKN